MTNNFLIDNSKHLTTTPENVEQLKKLVLQIAVQGKLTVQWRKDVQTRYRASHDILQSPDYNAHALLEKIKAEKKQLIKEGKIKRQKPLPPISDEEKPFELPESWEWCRMSQAGLFARGKSKHRPRNDKTLFENGTIPFVQTGDVAQSRKFNYRIEKCNSYYNEKGLAQSNLWRKNTLCITIAANIAFTGFLDFDACFPDSVVGFTSLVGTNLSKYLRYFIELTKEDIEQFAPATAQKNINLGILNELIIPLPPLAEQQAIVSQVEKLFTQIDQLHALAHKRLNYREKSAKAIFSKINHAENDTELQETWGTLKAHFHNLTQSKESVKQLRQSILQMAVQGKLTARWREENPDVEPASVLLENIKSEKEQLIKSKEIRKLKYLRDSIPEEINNKAPRNWAITRLGNVISYRKGKKPPVLVHNKTNEYKIPYIDIKAFEKNIIEKYTTDEKIISCYSKNIIIVWDGARMGLTGTNAFGALGSTLAKIDYYGIQKDYLYLFLKSQYVFLNSNPKQAGLPHLNPELLENLEFMFPCHEEQKAIVSKVKQLMAWCDELEKKIEKRDAYQEKMMQAVVKQAFRTEKEKVEME